MSDERNGGDAKSEEMERLSIEGGNETMSPSDDLGAVIVDDAGATSEGTKNKASTTSVARLGEMVANIEASEQSIEHKTRRVVEGADGEASGPAAGAAYRFLMASTDNDNRGESSSSQRVNKISGEMLEEESAASARRYFLSLTKTELENNNPTQMQGHENHRESTISSSRPGAYPVGFHSNSEGSDDPQEISLPNFHGQSPIGSLLHTQEPPTGDEMMMESNADANADANAGNQLGNLVEANPVVSEVFDISRMQTAEAVEQSDSENQKSKPREVVNDNRCGSAIIGSGIFFLSCVVLTIMLSVFLQSSSKDPPLAPTTRAPLLSPSESPSIAPSESMLLPNLPKPTLEKLQNISTPQWKAMDWLSRHPELSTMPAWRKTQLFSLAAFYYAFEGPYWREVVQERWMQYEVSECLWFSSEYGSFRDEDQPIAFSEDRKFNLDPCNDQGEMQTLVLDDLELAGRPAFIPPQLALLTSLAYLALRRNGVENTLENLLPSEIYQLPNLTVLALNDNRGLTGALTTELGLLSRLQNLELDDNSHTGLLPSELSEMTQLKKLLLHRNKRLNGRIPSEFARMTNMVALALNQNSLTGICSQLGLLTNLEFLQLAKNSLRGTIPLELGFLTAMLDVRFQFNRLTGTLPSEVAMMTLLNRLNFGHNNIHGKIPTQYGCLSNMEQLYLHSSHLTGPIPTELGRLVKISNLMLQDNRLTGTIPTQLGHLSTMMRHILSNNQLVGTVPSEYGLLTKLVELSLDSNQLSGKIPTNLDLLVGKGSLERLRLCNTTLSGTVTKALCSLGQYNYTDPQQDRAVGLQFDCHDQLCGCDWCVCNWTRV